MDTFEEPTEHVDHAERAVAQARKLRPDDPGALALVSLAESGVAIAILLDELVCLVRDIEHDLKVR